MAKVLPDGLGVRLVGLADRRLREAIRTQPPNEAESEVAYTARVLVPALRALKEQLELPHFIVGGDGAPTPRLVVPVKGIGNYWPDLFVRWGNDPLVCYEVKVLTEGNRTQAFATGLGQATLYLTMAPYSRLILVGGSALEHLSGQFPKTLSILS